MTISLKYKEHDPLKPWTPPKWRVYARPDGAVEIWHMIHKGQYNNWYASCTATGDRGLVTSCDPEDWGREFIGML